MIFTAFFTSVIGLSAAAAATAVSLTLTVASMAYQQSRMRKLKAELDKRKQVNVAVDGEPFYLPVVYGRAKVSGGKVKHLLKSNYVFANESGSRLTEGPFFTSGVTYYKEISTYDTALTSLFNKSEPEIFWQGVNKSPAIRNNTLISSLPFFFSIASKLNLGSKFFGSVRSTDGYTYVKGKTISRTLTTSGTTITITTLFEVSRYTTIGKQIFSSNLLASQSGSKNEYLFVQQAICYGGISRVIDITVDDKSWDDDTLKHGQRIVVNTAGGTASDMATANGIVSTNNFTNTANATMCFRLNREEYNYNGSPNVSFFVEGQLIHDIEYNDTTKVFSLSSTKVYSNNPALVLLDYLTNNVYGKGLPLSFIDLESFYISKVLCSTIVSSDLSRDGRVNGRRPDVENEDGTIVSQPQLSKYNIPLYECNTVLDTERPIRENIEIILESMEEAELLWSGGKYKLSMYSPRTEQDVNDLISLYINEDDIVLGRMELEFPDSSTKNNQCVARFMNEFENFVDDTVTWPTTFSAPYNQYLAEDGGLLLKTEVYLPCTSDPYHALAKAEQFVRMSRRSMRAIFSVNKKGLLLEPGDIISVTDSTSGLNNEIMKIESVKLNQDLTADIEARQYSFTTIAWNVPDDVPYISTKTNFYYGVTKPSNLQFVIDTSTNLVSIGKLVWSFPNDVAVDSYQVEYSLDNTTWVILGRTKTEFFEITTLKPNTYYFRVKSVSPSNSLSNPVIIGPISFSRGPNAPYNLTTTGEIYYTNTSAGFKSRAILNWQIVSSVSNISVLNYLVEFKLSSDSIWSVWGETYLPSAVIDDLKVDTAYDFRITSVSYLGDKSTSLVTTGFVSSSLSTPPGDPTGLSITSSGNGLSTLSWNLPVDIDVIHGGAVSIRHSPLTGVSATWDTATDLVEELSGNTSSKTVPTLQGTYFIKFKDSTGNYSVNPSLITNTFVDTNFNFVGEFPQEPTFTGVKTGLTVVSGAMLTSVGATLGVYEFATAIDLGEKTSVRLIPNINAAIFDRSNLFCNIPVVCNSTNICGTSISGSVKFFISLSDNGVNYTPWEVFLAGTYNTRYFKIKVELDCRNINSFFEVYELGVQIDTQDRIYKGKVTTSSTTSTTVTFPNGGFYGGLVGSTQPTVGLQTINAQEGDTPIITSRTKTGFTFSVWRQGERVVREVDWQAIGQ